MAVDLENLTIAGAAELISARKLSPVELVQATLDRIAKLDPALSAYVTVTGEQALAEAKQAESEIAAGRLRGPLHGIPFGIKDLYQTQGVLTTGGMKRFSEWFPEEDSEAVARLRRAGAVINGKLNTHEAAYGVTTDNMFYGRTRNPWNRDLIPGGSSGGSGAAMAASLCLGTLGSDTGGSIRIPSSLCGVTGLKPTYGRVSRRGIVTMGWSCDHAGPLLRDCLDTALVMQALAGHDPLDDASSREPVPDYRAELEKGASGLRFAVLNELLADPLDGEVERLFQAALPDLERAGMKQVKIAAPLATFGTAATMVMISAETSGYHEQYLRERPEDYSPDVRSSLEGGMTVLAVDYLRAQRLRTALNRQLAEAMKEVDLLVVPTTGLPARPIGEFDVREYVRFTAIFDLTGQPALSVPCGFTSDGLPVGLQLVGRPFEETTVLRAGHAYQQVTDWHLRRPSTEY
jgi:aspartyl-tRNA(Asn)/glutamyl-tRNA(Gln) amidotransferase subunit A